MNDQSPMPFTDLLRAYVAKQKKQGTSKLRVASDAGVPQTKLSKYLSGDLPGDEDRVKALARACEASEEEFVHAWALQRLIDLMEAESVLADLLVNGIGGELSTLGNLPAKVLDQRVDGHEMGDVLAGMNRRRKEYAKLLADEGMRRPRWGLRQVYELLIRRGFVVDTTRPTAHYLFRRGHMATHDGADAAELPSVDAIAPPTEDDIIKAVALQLELSPRLLQAAVSLLRMMKEEDEC